MIRYVLSEKNGSDFKSKKDKTIAGFVLFVFLFSYGLIQEIK